MQRDGIVYAQGAADERVPAANPLQPRELHCSAHAGGARIDLARNQVA